MKMAPKFTKVSATRLQQKTREVIDEVRISGVPAVIMHHNRPIAQLNPFQDGEAKALNDSVSSNSQKLYKKPSLEELRKYMRSYGRPTDVTKFYREMRDAE